MISFIIPTYNRALSLKKAIESVFSQIFQDFELVVIDDGSGDNTSSIVSSYNSHKIKYVMQENKGPASARNLGIKTAQQEYITFLDSDDWWDKEKLAIQLEGMQKNPQYLISHTQEIWYKNGNVLDQKKKHKKYHGYIFDKCIGICAVSMSTVMARRKLFDEIGLFDETLPCCEDYDFWLRASIKYEFLLIDKPLTFKDGGRPDQVSSIYATGMDKFRIHSLLKLLKSETLNADQQKLALSELHKKCRIYGNGCLKHGKIEEGQYYLNLAIVGDT
jgi:glycosyltransferase involved in cell wall biosynthesis